MLLEPLPMKQRALPQSFWQQPNVANPQPPGVVISNLPPLPLGGGDEGGEDITPVEEVSFNGAANGVAPGANVAATAASAAAAAAISAAAAQVRPPHVVQPWVQGQRL